MAFALLNTRPKRDDEWEYLKQGEEDGSVPSLTAEDQL